MSRLQLALNVSNLDEAVSFYSKLFATPPNKVHDGYANFAIADPPLKLVLFEGVENGSINHIGIEAEDPAGVTALLERTRAAGLTTTEQANTECCFAEQSKGYVAGADGHNWEIYSVLEDLDTADGIGCCGPEGESPESVSIEAGAVAACCPPAAETTETETAEPAAVCCAPAQ